MFGSIAAIGAGLAVLGAGLGIGAYRDWETFLSLNLI